MKNCQVRRTEAQMIPTARHTTTAKRIGRPAAFALFALGLTLLSGCAAFEPAAFPWVEFFVGLVNFGIFAWVIIKFGGPLIQEYFADRRETFLREMNAAQEARQEAEAKLEEYNAKLEALEQERQALLDEYHARGEREKQRIIEAAKDSVEKMRVDAEATIDQEVKKAVAILEEQAVDLAVEMARKKAVDSLDADRQQKLFQRYIADLEGSKSALN